MLWYYNGVVCTIRNCACCGKRFHPKLADVRRGWGRFCGNACKNRARRGKRRGPAKVRA